jgi:hypothetical protein
LKFLEKTRKSGMYRQTTFNTAIKNFHNLGLRGIWGIGPVKWWEIGGYQITMFSKADRTYSTIQLRR